LQHGHVVRALVRKNSDQSNIKGLDVDIVYGDLTERRSLDKALQGCSALFHVAADYRLWVANPEHIYKTNVEGTRNIINAAVQAGVSRIVYTSSVATLGLNADASPADENTDVSFSEMIGHYKRSKYLAEQEVRQRALTQGVPVVIVNPSTPVGPRDAKPTPTGRMIMNAVAGKMPAYVDTGLNVVHVDDVAEGHCLAFDKGRIGERYILGGENLTLQAILGQIAAMLQRSPPRWRLPHNLVLPVAYVCEYWARHFSATEPLVTVDGVQLAKKKMYFSSAKARHELGYASRPASEALYDAVQWFLRRESRPRGELSSKIARESRGGKA
jgi:dihydroflavonol-4-reductase